jgi:putative addiction module component (TIGR02574 family)
VKISNGSKRQSYSAEILRFRASQYKEMIMGKPEIIQMALLLKASDRYEIVEQIMQSLDKHDTEIVGIWADEAMHRARACDDGRMKTLSFDEVFVKK